MKAIYTIGPDGNVQIDVVGGQGTNCRDFTRPVEDALGLVTRCQAKPEGLQDNPQHQQPKEQW